MIIEVLGCTSSGKSTVIKKIIAGAADINTPIAASYPGGISVLSLLFGDFLKLIYVIIFSKNRLSFLHFLRTCLNRTDSLWMRINLFRNFIKKQGEVYIARRHRHVDIVLMDEGCLHAFSNIFCHYDDYPDTEYASKLMEFIPKPDVILRVMVSEDVMVERANQRLDPPWPNLEDIQWRRIFRHTNILYQTILASLDDIPVIVIDSSDTNITNVIEQLNSIYLRENLNGS